MKKYLSLAILLTSVAVAIAAPDKDALQAKENAAWQAFKDKKPDDFKRAVSAEMIGVYAEGVSDMAKEIADMQKWDMKSFAISDYKVVSGEADTAVTTYTVKLEGTYDGKDASGSYVAGSVWKKQHGEWKAIFHTNIKEAAPAK